MAGLTQLNATRVKVLIRKMEAELKSIESAIKKVARKDANYDLISAQISSSVRRLTQYYRVVIGSTIDIGGDLTSRLRLTLEEAVRIQASLAGDVGKGAESLVRDQKASIQSSWRRGERKYAHELWTRWFKRYSLTVMLEFSRHTYLELLSIVKYMKEETEEAAKYFRNRPMTVLKKLLVDVIKWNINESFKNKSSLPGDMLIPNKPVKWQNLNPVYARISGRRASRPGSASLRNNLMARAASFARVFDGGLTNVYKDTGSMRFFLKLASRYGRGTKWFWKVYSFYFGSDGLMFGGKIRRKKLRGEGRIAGRAMRKPGLKPRPGARGKWPHRVQPARPFTLLKVDDISDLASLAEEHASRRFKRIFAARLSMRYIRAKNEFKIVREKDRGGWTSFALKEMDNG
jgi:hypothetical protein